MATGPSSDLIELVDCQLQFDWGHVNPEEDEPVCTSPVSLDTFVDGKMVDGAWLGVNGCQRWKYVSQNRETYFREKTVVLIGFGILGYIYIYICIYIYMCVCMYYVYVYIYRYICVHMQCVFIYNMWFAITHVCGQCEILPKTACGMQWVKGQSGLMACFAMIHARIVSTSSFTRLSPFQISVAGFSHLKDTKRVKPGWYKRWHLDGSSMIFIHTVHFPLYDIKDMYRWCLDCIVV